MKKIKDSLKNALYSTLLSSLKSARREQGLEDLSARLEKIAPDISRQYSTFRLDSEFLNVKARSLHAFQISLADSVMKEFEKLTIVDIGDSAGTHLEYILGMHSPGKDIKCLSVNLDPGAVERIRAKGLEALNARAEELDKHNVDADVFLCFETLEHLTDPCRFLHGLSRTGAKYLVITVPYVRHSRVGLGHIRKGFPEDRFAENTHIFELSPRDWKLIARHAGWGVLREKVYLQYPKRNPFAMTRRLWQIFDFEGFYGMVLKKDSAYSSKYKGW